jgi:Pvc16 N-terminal domain
VIRDLDETLRQLIGSGAAAGSLLATAATSFDLPDAAWQGQLSKLTINFYLYDIVENREMRTNEALLARSADGKRAARIAPPVRIDCAYCVTAWSVATVGEPVLEEHQLLSDVLLLLLRNPTIPGGVLQGSLTTQMPPYPTIIASTDAMKNHPQFWNALDQKLKPSLNYVVTLAMLLDDLPADADIVTGIVQQIDVNTEDMSRAPKQMNVASLRRR